jgi:hypothetical protein
MCVRFVLRLQLSGRPVCVYVILKSTECGTHIQDAKGSNLGPSVAVRI